MRRLGRLSSATSTQAAGAKGRRVDPSGRAKSRSSDDLSLSLGVDELSISSKTRVRFVHSQEVHQR